jgi:hypothetical protein
VLLERYQPGLLTRLAGAVEAAGGELACTESNPFQLRPRARTSFR